MPGLLLSDSRPVVARLVRKVDPASGGVVVANVHYRAEVFDGWTSAATNEQMGDAWTTDLTLPNDLGPDGQLHRDRFAISRNRLSPVEGASTYSYIGSSYRPGDEWIELHDGDVSGEPAFVGTPVEVTLTRSTIVLKLVDALELTKHTYENSAGFYRHAPRDVIEDCCRVWQARLSTAFDEGWSFARDEIEIGAPGSHVTPDGKWQYSRSETPEFVDEAIRVPDSVRLRCIAPSQQAIWAANSAYPGGLNATLVENRMAPWRVEARILLPKVEIPQGSDGLPTNILQVGMGDQHTGEAWAAILHESRDTFFIQTLVSGTNTSDAVWQGGPGVGTIGARPGPYHYVVEGREGYVYFYINSQLIGVLPMPPAPGVTTQFQMVPMVVLSSAANNTEEITATIESFMFRRGEMLLMRGREDDPATYGGDLHLPGLPVPGGLIGTYYTDDSLENFNRLAPINEEYARRVDTGINFDYAALQNQKDTVGIVRTGATGGVHFTLTINGETTGLIVFNDSLANLTAAIEALPSVGPLDFVITGFSGAGGSVGLNFTIEWQGAFSGQPVTFHMDVNWTPTGVTLTRPQEGRTTLWWPSGGGPAIEGKLSVRWTGAIELPLADADKHLHLVWSGARSPRVWVGKTRAGEAYLDSAPPSVNQEVTVTLSATGGTYTLTVNGETSTPFVWNDDVPQHQARLEAMAVFEPGDVALFPVGAGTPPTTSRSWKVVVGGRYAGVNLAFSVNGSALTGTVSVASTVTAPAPHVYAAGSLRAHLDGSETTGWYPLVIEYKFQGAAPGPLFKLFWSTTGVDADKVIVPAASFAPEGIYLEDASKKSRYEVLQSVLETFGHQFALVPEQLESGRFPGSLIPRVREGRDTERILESGEAVQPQLTVKSDQVADALFADATGLADDKQLTVEVFNWDELDQHLFVFQAYDQIGDISIDAELRQRLQSMLKLHSTLWEEVAANPSDAPDERIDSWPLTGEQMRFRWAVGDGVRLWIPELGIEDLVPRQILTVSRLRRPDGMSALSIAWRQRSREVEKLMRKWRRQFISQARADQGDRTTTTGTVGTNAVGAGAGPETTSVVVMPVKRWKIMKVDLTVFGKTDASPWLVEINGTATTRRIYRDGTYSILEDISGPDFDQSVLVVRLIPGGEGKGEASFTTSVVQRI